MCVSDGGVRCLHGVRQTVPQAPRGVTDRCSLPGLLGAGFKKKRFGRAQDRGQTRISTRGGGQGWNEGRFRTLLLCFGLPAVPGCDAEDINEDGTVNVLDPIQLLLQFGATCP